jgi:peptidoglycan/xylan/chitin deacetylase (PgdA/CDA1 family)
MKTRWALKRVGKWMVEWGATLSGAALVYRKSGYFRTGFRILTYHGVQRIADDSYTVSVEHFRRHMEYLSDYYPVTDLLSLVDGLAGSRHLEPRSVVVTLDDGYKECATYVAEILDRYCIPATFFVSTGPLDTRETVRGRNFVSWDDLRSMTAAGFSIGSHAVSHKSLVALSPGEAEKELIVSRKRIEEELGTPPAALSYPYGTLRDVSPQVAALAVKAGYSCAVTAIHGLNHRGVDPLWLRRTSLTAGDGLRTFRMIMRGCLDAWHLVDRWGYRFQRTEAGAGF